jgi:hypothetical protein
MRAKKLLLRCYAERTDDLWLAFCLDFSLGVQADTLDEARAKLEAQIRDYVRDALNGEDRAHAGVLLSRRAPLVYWLKYWWAGVVGWMARETRVQPPAASRRFREAIPLVPAPC